MVTGILLFRSRQSTGIICTNHFWPGLVEIAMRAQLDYLIIDLEHVLQQQLLAFNEAVKAGRRPTDQGKQDPTGA